MTKEEFATLISGKVQSFIEDNIDKDPAKLALSAYKYSLPVPLIASQIKYLQRAANKLPTYYHQRCILPPRAFEQASSEQSTSLKPFSGSRCLDLTAGFGVDRLAISRHASTMICVDKNTVLCEILTYNFAKMGISLPEIVNDSAESFINQYEGPVFDLIYLDPDRRQDDQKRLEDPASFSPNIFEILPRLLEIGKKIWVKFSPLHEVSHLPQQFYQVQQVMVISVDGECKEVLAIFRDKEEKSLPEFHALIHQGEKSWSYLFQEKDADVKLMDPNISYGYVHKADVSFYKLNRAMEWWAQVVQKSHSGMNHAQGYFFTQETLTEDLPVRSYKILENYLFKPKKLKKALKGLGINRVEISKRHFPFSVAEIRRSLGIAAGGSHQLICTTFPDGSKRALLCEAVKS
ncbi:MAG: class I SAM-dependent methyltransferase [Bacteroidota bacterium]